MSGHSKWSKVKHKKKIKDARKGKLFSKLVRDIQVAARKDTNPETNPDLRMAIDKAKEANMPSENIEGAIQRVKDQNEGGKKITLEAFGPDGITMLITATTDNRNRTVSEVRHILSRNNAKLGDKGSTQWMFEQKAQITIDKRLWQENLELKLIDAGMEDFKERKENVKIITTIPNLNNLKEVLKKEKVKIEQEKTIWIPKNPAKKPASDNLQPLIEDLKQNPDIEGVYTNFI